MTQQFYFSETTLEKYSHVCTNRHAKMCTKGPFLIEKNWKQPKYSFWWAEWWPPKMSMSSSLEPVDETLDSKGDFAGVIKLRLLQWGEPGLPRWALHVIKWAPVKGLQGESIREDGVMTDQRAGWQILRTEEGATSQGIQAATRSCEKGKGTDSPLEPLERTRSAHTWL